MEIFVREKRIGFTEDWLKWRITRNTRRRERLQKTTHPILLAHANATRALIAAFIHAYTSINALVSIYHTNCSCIRDEAATSTVDCNWTRYRIQTKYKYGCKKRVLKEKFNRRGVSKETREEEKQSWKLISVMIYVYTYVANWYLSITVWNCNSLVDIFTISLIEKSNSSLSVRCSPDDCVVWVHTKKIHIWKILFCKILVNVLFHIL